ncbi:MAG: hypothetical protein ABH849_02015 [Nanoarchaeota archaeon]
MKFLKKAAAVGMSVAMLGMTAAGALAADLADYPGPFIANDAFVSTALVIGSTDDSAARSDINTYLGGQATAVSGDVTVSGGKQEEFVFETGFNDATAFSGGLTDTHIDTLIDSKVSWGDTNFDVAEIINFTASTKIVVSGNSSSYKEFGADPYMVAAGTDTIYYWYWFDNVFNASKKDSYNVSTTNPLTINFLGKSLEITDVGANALTINMADKLSAGEGDTVTVDGYTLTVGSIFSGSVEVSYGGDTQLISDGNTHDFGPLSVKVEDIGQNTNNPDLSKAILYIGSKVSDTVSHGEVFELFTDYDPDGSAPWSWVISSTDNTLLYYAGITNRLNIDTIDATDNEYDPVAPGGSIILPNNFAAIKFDEVTNTDYETIEFSPNTNLNMNASGSTRGKTGLVISTSKGKSLTIDSQETDRIYALEDNTYMNASLCLNGTWDLWYDNSEGIKTDASNAYFQIIYDDTTLVASWWTNASGSNNGSFVQIGPDSTGSDGNITFGNFTDTGCLEYFGNTEDQDTTKNEITYAGGAGVVSARDYDVLTPYGTIIVDPEANLDLNKVVIKVPNDLQKAKVTVSATLSSSGSGTEAALMTDDEVGTASDYNLILVGGPCVNSLTAQFLGLSAGSCGAASTFSADTAYLKLKDNGDKVALIVAGWEAADTKRAAKVVANPDSFTLSGESMTVTGTSLEVSGITVV